MTHCARNQFTWDFRRSSLPLHFHSSCPLVVDIQLQPSRQKEGSFQTLHPSHFVQQVVLSRGKVIMKLSLCQQPYWIDGQKTERTLCLKLSKPVGLRSDDSVCPWQKYPWHSVCVYMISICPHRNSPPVGHANIQTLPMLTLRSLQNCCCVLLLSKNEKIL